MWEALGEYHGPPTFKVFVRYVAARAYRQVELHSFMVYVTDSLRLVPQMSYVTRRWYDIISSATSGEAEKTADEIVDGVIAGLEG